MINVLIVFFIILMLSYLGTLNIGIFSYFAKKVGFVFCLFFLEIMVIYTVIQVKRVISKIIEEKKVDNKKDITISFCIALGITIWGLFYPFFWSPVPITTFLLSLLFNVWMIFYTSFCLLSLFFRYSNR